MTATQRTILCALSLIALTLLVFGRLCAAEFVQFDDPQTIANNPAFNPPSIEKIAAYWIKPEGNLYIPLTYSFWGALAYIARVDSPDETGSLLNPWVFHTANVVLHCITALIVFAILRGIVKQDLAAWIGAAIFAVHPVQVETVAWASGTKDLLCALFLFASILMLIRRQLMLTSVFVLLACLAKPTGIIAPAMLLIIDTLVCGTNWRRSLRNLWPTIIIAVAFAIVGMIVQPPLMSEETRIWLRPLVALDALSFYLWKLIWPMSLGIDYGRTPARIIESGAIWWTGVISLVIGVIVAIVRQRTVTAGALMFFVGVAPVLGLIPFTFQTISTVADHYLYPSMLGVALLVAAMGQRARFVLPLIVVLLAMRSFIAAGTWQNNSALFANALAVNPRSAMSHTNWGVAMSQHGDADAALDHFRQATTANPDYAFARLNLASLLQSRGQSAEAAREYRELLRIYRKQRNVSPELEAGVQQIIDQLERREDR